MDENCLISNEAGRYKGFFLTLLAQIEHTCSSAQGLRLFLELLFICVHPKLLSQRLLAIMQITSYNSHLGLLRSEHCRVNTEQSTRAVARPVSLRHHSGTEVVG